MAHTGGGGGVILTFSVFIPLSPYVLWTVLSDVVF